MIEKRRIIMAAGVLGIAAASGHLMQSGGSTSAASVAPTTIQTAEAPAAPVDAQVASADAQAMPGDAQVARAAMTPTTETGGAPKLGAPTNQAEIPQTQATVIGSSNLGQPSNSETSFAPQPDVSAEIAGASVKTPMPDMNSFADQPVGQSLSVPALGQTGNATQVLASAEGFSNIQLPTSQEPETGFSEVCETSLATRTAAGAMVSLELDASCSPNERIVVTHAGMRFAASTDAAGHFETEIPALEEQALFDVQFADGTVVSSQTEVLTLMGYDRVALQWKGDVPLHIHALEFGAQIGEPGHVWASAPRDPSVALRGEGGFLTSLGNPDVPAPLLAEVYSFPANRVDRSGSVELRAEAEMAAGICGQDIAATATQISESGQRTDTEVTLYVPECDEVGGFLVLQNLLQGLKIAQK